MHAKPRVVYTCWVTIVAILTQIAHTEATFRLTLVHTGDIHARFQQIDRYAAECSDGEALNGECYGGFARLATAISDIREAEENVLLLDTGDIFQGTL